MEPNLKNVTTIDEYIAEFPKDVQLKLKELRTAIKDSAPDAEEVISYHMPAFKQSGILVYFAAHKNHIGLYPAPRAIEAFAQELSSYEGAKGTIKFPLNKPLPLDLVSRIVKFRVAENLKKAENKKSNKK